MRLTTADVLVSTLADKGVDVVFSVSGWAIAPLELAFRRQSAVRVIHAVHEQGAGHMAQGYARASGKVGVVAASAGQSATNLLTPIADAWMDSTPLVCITGQHRRGSDATGVEIARLVDPIVKRVWSVTDAAELRSVVEEAFELARGGRCRPVLIDIPVDVLAAPASESAAPADSAPPEVSAHVDAAAIADAASEIVASESPILYVGGGVLNAHAERELLSLAEDAGLPVVTTLMGKSALSERHELHFGWPGMHGPKWSNLALNHADLIIAVGARFDDRVTGRLDAFAPRARVIHLDADAAEIGKIRSADIALVGNLKATLQALEREFASVRPSRWNCDRWRAEIEAWRDEFPLRFDTGSIRLKPQRVAEILQERAEDAVFATGVGQHQMWAMQYLRPQEPRTFITSGGLGTMGYGLPAAIGAKAARPDKHVICIDGDGCFQMTCKELETAVRENLPIVTVILNNGYLGMVTQWQDMFFSNRRSHTTLSSEIPDFAKVAEAFGGIGITVATEDEFVAALEEAMSSGRTVVIDCRTDPTEQCFPMILPGGAAVDVVAYPEELAVNSLEGQAVGAALTREAL